MESGGLELTDGGGIGYTAFTHLDGFFGQEGCQTEGVVNRGDEGAEVAVVDTAEVRLQVGIFQFLLTVHFEQYLQLQVVGSAQQVATFCLRQFGCDQQGGRRSAEPGLEELVFVDGPFL